MSKWQKILLGWSVVALAAAEYVRHLHLGDRAQVWVGATEILLAIATGAAFGVVSIRKKV